MAEHPFKPLEPAVLPGNEHALREFTEFFRQEAMNPPKVNELFKIPEGLSPEWQRIFDTVASYYERQSAITRLNLISLEKKLGHGGRELIRIRNAEHCDSHEGKGLSAIKHEYFKCLLYPHFYCKGNEEFRKGNLTQAQVLYVSAIATFPTPDVMNNLAACCLKLNQ